MKMQILKEKETNLTCIFYEDDVDICLLDKCIHGVHIAKICGLNCLTIWSKHQ